MRFKVFKNVKKTAKIFSHVKAVLKRSKVSEQLTNKRFRLDINNKIACSYVQIKQKTRLVKNCFFKEQN